MVHDYRIREYRPSDRDAVLRIFQSNCPKYFQAADEADLIDYLTRFANQNFLVIHHLDRVLGCGGHYVRDDKRIIGIAWVMFKRNAIGSRILLGVADLFFAAILAAIQKESSNYPILINTTQHMEKLFQRYGFQTQTRIGCGFGEKLDHLVMIRHC